MVRAFVIVAVLKLRKFPSITLQMFTDMYKFECILCLNIIPNCSKFDFRNDDRYKDILLSLNCTQMSADRITSAPEFLFFCFIIFFLYIQMFFYTIIKLLISLLAIVNKSRTSAGRLSLGVSK
jgi:hypothetical protein